MDQNKVDMYVMTNQKYFPAEKIMYLKEKLAAMDENKFTMVSTVELKDPTTILLVSIFLGGLGIDRFMLGDTGMGILTIIDWFTVSKKTKDLNFNNIMTIL